MSTRREKRPDLHDHLVQMNKAAGTLHVPSDEIVQVTAGPEGFDAEDLKREALVEVVEQGCTCGPEVTIEVGPDRIDGVLVAHVFFDHEPWCPLLRAISEVAR